MQKHNSAIASEIYEKALRMFDAIDEVVYVADQDTYELLFTNSKFNYLWEGNLSKHKGRKCYKVIQGLDNPCEFCTNEIIFKKKPDETHIWEFQNRKNNRWYRCYDKAIEWIDGKMVRMEMAMDITSEKLAQIKLQESEDRYKLIERATNHGIWDWNIVTDEVYYSPAWKAQIGFSDHELENTFGVWIDHLHPEDKERCQRAIDDYISNPTGKFILDFRFRHKKGYYVWIHNEAASQLDKDGNLIRVFGAHSDVAEKRLFDEELKLKNTAFETSIAANCIFNANGEISNANKSMMNFWEYRDITDLRNIAFRDLFFIGNEADLMLKVLNNTGRSEGTFTALKKNGSTFTALSSSVKLEDDQGNTVGYHSSFLDISEIINAEKKIRESERKFHVLYDLAPDMYASVSPHTGDILECNDTFLKNMGYTRAEAIGHPVFNFYDESVLDKALELFEKFKKSGEIRNAELFLKRKDNTLLDVSLNVNSLKDEHGNIVQSMYSWRDITALKEVQRQVLDEKEFTDHVINVMPGIFYMFDNHGKFLRWNNAFREKSGKTDQEIRNSNPLDYIIEEDRERIKNAIETVFNKGSIIVEAGFLDSQGKGIPNIFSANRIFRNNEPLLIGVGMDISERVKSEEELKLIAIELKRSNIELEQFASVASHDLQEPLRMISSYTQLLQKRYEGELDEKADMYIGIAVDGAKRMQLLILDLLKYSRISTRGENFTDFDAKIALEEAIHNLQSSILRSGAKIEFKNLPTIYGDKAQIERLFMNLVSNGIKFARDNQPPAITISAERSRQYWKFTVADNGIGIDKSYYEKIFVIFQRLHSKEDKYEGTGIGLAICKRIVERHGGEISVKSTPGKGTKFYFTIRQKL